MSNVTAITGAAGAVGSALARRLGGGPLLLLDVPAARERLHTLAAELGDAEALGLDLSTEAAWDEVHQASIGRFGSAPNGAALIAGGWAGPGPVHAATDDEAWHRMMALNADTVHTALRRLLPPMVAAKRGSIVVIGARPVERPWTGAGAAAYTASKAATVALAQAVAEEVRMSGVRVNAVLPSMIDTGANRAAMPQADPSTWVTTESLGDVIAFLLSDAARDVSGAAIPVYGRT